MPGQELSGPELVRIARTLAKWAVDGDVNPKVVWRRLDLSPTQFPAQLNPENLWYETTCAIHAGRSRSAGFRSDAVAHLVNAVAQELQGNDELNQLAYDLGKTGVRRQAARSAIFLSYATPDRSDVDQLFDSIARLAPGFATFQDHRSLRPGASWLDEIRHAAGSSTVLACWLTANYLASAFCNYEVGIADSRGSTIVPILVDSTLAGRVPGYISGHQMIFADKSFVFDELARRLLTAFAAPRTASTKQPEELS